MSAELEALFSSIARIRVLDLFLRNPDRRFYQREIEREIDQPIRAVQREVERLEGIGLLHRSEEGNRVFYGLNPGFALLAELTALFQKAAWGGDAPQAAGPKPAPPPEPRTVPQPFSWLETPPIRPLPAALQRRQVEGEWDRSY